MDKIFTVRGKDLYVSDGHYNSDELSAKTRKFSEPEFFKSFDSHQEAVAYARDYYKQNNPLYTDCVEEEDEYEFEDFWN